MSVFMYNIKIMGIKKIGVIERVITKQTFAFSIVDIGPITFYLDQKIEQD